VSHDLHTEIRHAGTGSVERRLEVGGDEGGDLGLGLGLCRSQRSRGRGRCRGVRGSGGGDGGFAGISLRFECDQLGMGGGPDRGEFGHRRSHGGGVHRDDRALFRDLGDSFLRRVEGLSLGRRGEQ
jgi:hypothetical protein